MSIDLTEGVCGFNRRSLQSDFVFCNFRGRRSRVQQIGGDAACQGRAIQRATVSQRSNYSHISSLLVTQKHPHSFCVISVEKKQSLEKDLCANKTNIAEFWINKTQQTDMENAFGQGQYFLFIGPWK